ncbi:YiaA/YiaB family inner membrane protein [Sphingobacterium corticis]|uniref:YiaA/YiaB family inner membrane protein n=1 Tax=Sphingobacterium corticis TaxID=1812823 RepID=A0ABW5NJF0_9SPHI
MTFYIGASWFALLTSVVSCCIGLWNADLLLSEKGFYAISFLLSVFSAIAVKKNTRDAKLFDDENS